MWIRFARQLVNMDHATHVFLDRGNIAVCVCLTAQLRDHEGDELRVEAHTSLAAAEARMEELVALLIRAEDEPPPVRFVRRGER